MAVIKRVLFYLILLIIFILGTNQWQKFTTKVGQESSYQFSVIKKSSHNTTEIDVTYYEINLEPIIDASLKEGILYGDVTVHFSVQIKEIQEISLNFSSVLVVDSVLGAQRFNHENNLLIIKLDKVVGKGNISRVRIYYHGWPKQYHRWIHGWQLFTKKQDSESFPWITTINPPYGAQTWFPCKDNPADKADSVRFQITLPDSLMAVCNGKLEEIREVPVGKINYIWKENYPISTYLIAVNIGPYCLFERMYKSADGNSFPVQIYCFDEDSSVTDLVFEQHENMFRFFNSVLGEYPFSNEKYGLIVYSAAGGMENQTITSVHGISPRYSNLYAHELAHQWFGNMITNHSFSESWISEGLATYFTGLYLKSTQGSSAFSQFLLTQKFLGKGKIWVTNINNPDSVYNSGPVYGKACWLFYMLHNRYGDQLFFQSITNCLRNNAYQTITVQKLKTEFEIVCGENLSRFFRQWIFEEYPPELSWNINLKTRHNQIYQYHLTVEQEQASKNPYVMPVEMNFKSQVADTVLIFEILERSHEFTIFLPFIADEISIDPENKLLMSSELKYSKN